MNMGEQRTMLVYVPNDEYVDEIKVVHDPTKLVKAIRFKRQFTHEVEKIEHSTDCGIYVLLNGGNEVYVGKSVNGIGRIQEHLYGGKQWDEAILFVTGNKRFDGLSIDYLEHRFIQVFLESKYEVLNTDYRLVKPTVEYTDELIFSSYEKEILFLLKFLGLDTKKIVDVQEVVNEEKQGARAKKKESKERYGYGYGDIDEGIELRFEPVNELYTEPVYYIDGRFVLKEGAEIKYPIEEGKKCKFHRDSKNLINSLILFRWVRRVEGGLLLLRDLDFSNPSTVAGLVTGKEKNGWDFYEGIRQVKKTGLGK